MEKKETNRRATVADDRKPDAFELMANLFTSGVDRLAEIQKKSLEIAVAHNAEVVHAWKLAAPSVLMLDLANSTFERFADTQKGAIDLVVEQTHTFAKLIKERKVKATESLEEGKERAKEAVEHSVAAQKTAIDYSVKQAKAAFATAKQQLGYDGTPVGIAADSMERGMDIVVEAQKELLDLVAHPALH